MFPEFMKWNERFWEEYGYALESANEEIGSDLKWAAQFLKLYVAEEDLGSADAAKVVVDVVDLFLAMTREQMEDLRGIAAKRVEKIAEAREKKWREFEAEHDRELAEAAVKARARGQKANRRDYSL